MCLSGFPPSTSLDGEVVSCKQDFLIGGNFRDFKIVLDGAEPIIRIQGLNRLGEPRRIGVLEVAKARTKSSSGMGLAAEGTRREQPPSCSPLEELTPGDETKFSRTKSVADDY